MSVDEKDPLDVESALERLGIALPLQLRSAAAYTIASGAITGHAYLALTAQLWGFAQAELEDVRRLVEKVVTLGGRPPSRVPELDLPAEPEAVLARLVAFEHEAIESLQDVIPATGHTGESEALEHRLEHTIMRKQEQLDALQRARGSVD
jgi:bacterioferritin (cytochrome b1)